MRTLLIAIGLVLVFCGSTFAEEEGECAQSKDPDLTIRGCTVIIEDRRRTPHNRGVAYFNRGVAYGNKGDDNRAIADFDQAIGLIPLLSMASALSPFTKEAIMTAPLPISTKPYGLTQIWKPLQKIKKLRRHLPTVPCKAERVISKNPQNRA